LIRQRREDDLVALDPDPGERHMRGPILVDRGDVCERIALEERACRLGEWDPCHRRMLPEGCDDAPIVGDHGWSSSLLRLTDLRDGRSVRIELDGSAVLLVRNGDQLFAIGNRCSHQGAPLHKGPVRFGGSLRTVQCPLHGSTFELTSGRVLRGPATEPVPAYETRVIDGVVEIRGR
jgi:nitrite reductase/ring-hydroxylating ferredoxin subunit